MAKKIYDIKALERQKRYPELKTILQAWLEQNPDDYKGYNNFSTVLGHLKEYEASEQAVNHALKLNPDFLSAYKNRGYLYYEMRRLDDSLRDYEIYLRAYPMEGDVWGKYALTLVEKGCHMAACAIYDKALALSPNDGVIKFNHSILRLLLGDLKTGFQHFEFRWHNSMMQLSPTLEVKRQLDQKNIPILKDLSDIKGKQILLMNEQGVGDTVQFIRYLPKLKQMGAHLIFGFYGGFSGLCSYFQHTDIIDEVLLKPKQFKNIDYYCPVGSLPVAFGIEQEEDIPPPYSIKPPKVFITKWQKKINDLLGKAQHKKRIAIIPTGNPGHPNDRARSASLEVMTPLFDEDAAFLLIQPDLRQSDYDFAQSRDNLYVLPDRLHDFTDAAAILTFCDLVITVDTGLLHISANLNLPVWGLLAYKPDWRWQLEREDTPWYPSLKLYRQPTSGDWKQVVAKVHQDLKLFLKDNKTKQKVFVNINK